QDTKPDIVFLDISFGNETGFDLLEQLPPQHFSLIFVTAYDQFALDAFRYNALDYVLKPIDPEALRKAVAKVHGRPARQQLREGVWQLPSQGSGQAPWLITLNNDKGYFFLPLEKILHVESIGKAVYFYCEGRDPVLVTKNIGEYEQMLPQPAFFRCHQSHLVHLRWVDSYLFADGGAIILRDGKQLPLARRRKDDFLDAMNTYSQEAGR
ncbi:MAG: response regulator transcription factor, partial [Lewinella sp.]|nr:response regulator transcription factor [Lewinella sp.]